MTTTERYARFCELDKPQRTETMSDYGERANARIDYLTEELAAAEEREEIARMDDVITHRRYRRALRRLREAIEERDAARAQSGRWQRRCSMAAQERDLARAELAQEEAANADQQRQFRDAVDVCAIATRESARLEAERDALLARCQEMRGAMLAGAHDLSEQDRPTMEVLRRMDRAIGDEP